MEFKSHFRMLPQTFEFILGEIAEQLQRTTSGNEMISPEKQFLIALWRMATPDSYRSIHTRFGVGKATAIRAVRRVTRTLCCLASRFIQWPSEGRIERIMQGFSEIGAFPRTIGAIDGTHINIPAPKENPEAYVNRKGHHSIQAQVVCDHTRLFTHVYVGNVGSVHDARVFRLSGLQNYIADPAKFPNDSHLIGDAAYPLLTQLMVPYTDNGHLTQREKNYNFCLSSSRMVVERAIGLLKGRWRSILHYLAMGSVKQIPYYFLACCVLHNICLIKNDDLEALLVINEEAAYPLQEIEGRVHNRAEVEAKRNLICARLRLREI
ncbi:putative nuclease HARBI1 [Temnothorax nylanderi]|uniref:putative nuclease HARBI1 n=1 Tax=Temnothorax nylanderi TaxID=102681 RepID=UPI003A886099